MCVPMLAHVCVCSPEVDVGVFLNYSLPCLWSQGLLLNPKLIRLTKLAGQQPPDISCFGLTPVLGLQKYTAALGFCVPDGDPNFGPHASEEAL